MGSVIDATEHSIVLNNKKSKPWRPALENLLNRTPNMTSLQSRSSNKNRKTLMSRKNDNNQRNQNDRIRASLGSKDLQDELDLTILKPKNSKKKWKDLGKIGRDSNDDDE